MTVSFDIIGKPQGKARARTGKGRTYTPEQTVLYENLVKMEYLRQCDGFRFKEDVPLRMEIDAIFEPLKNTPKKTRALMLSDRILPLKKPDVDNIAKVIADSLNGVAYKDDSQIASMLVNKYYGEQAAVNVRISNVIPYDDEP